MSSHIVDQEHAVEQQDHVFGNVASVARQAQQEGDLIEFTRGGRSIVEATAHVQATNAQDMGQLDTEMLNVHARASSMDFRVDIWTPPHSDAMVVSVQLYSVSVGVRT